MCACNSTGRQRLVGPGGSMASQPSPLGDFKASGRTCLSKSGGHCLKSNTQGGPRVSRHMHTHAPYPHVYLHTQLLSVSLTPSPHLILCSLTLTLFPGHSVKSVCVHAHTQANSSNSLSSYELAMFIQCACKE